MNLVWVGFLGALLLVLVRRHGWEYLPVIVLVGIGRWYALRDGYGDLSVDGVAPASVAGVWLAYSLGVKTV